MKIGWRNFVCGALLVMAAAMGMRAQTAVTAASGVAKLPEWDVVSVKPVERCGVSVVGPERDGFHITCMPLLWLIKEIYEVGNFDQIVGAPKWSHEIFYNIDAKVDEGDVYRFDGLDRSQRYAMMQALLADRFALKVHKEMRVMPVYLLVVAKGGAKLKPAVAREPGKMPAMTQIMTGGIDAKESTLEFLPNLLTAEVGRHVVDRTGLTGKYEFSLRFAPARGTGVDGNAPSIFTALQEQMGLKLVPGKVPVEVLVIDHAEMPAAN